MSGVASPTIGGYRVAKPFTFAGQHYAAGDVFDAIGEKAAPDRVTAMIRARLLVSPGDVQDARLRAASSPAASLAKKPKG